MVIVETNKHRGTQQDRTIGKQALATLGEASAVAKRWQLVWTRACVPAIGPESSNARPPGKYQDRVPGNASELLEHPELAGAVALAPGIEKVPPLRIVVPQLQTASVGDHDPAIAETRRSDDPVEKVALAFVGAPDDHAWLVGEAPDSERAL